MDPARSTSPYRMNAHHFPQELAEKDADNRIQDVGRPTCPQIETATILPRKVVVLTNDPKANHLLILPLFKKEAFNWKEALDPFFPLMLEKGYCWHPTSKTWQHQNGTSISLTTIKAMLTLAIFKDAQSDFQKSWNLHKEDAIHSIEKELNLIIGYLPVMQTTLFFEITMLLEEYGFNWDEDYYRWYHEKGAVMPLPTIMDQVEQMLGRFDSKELKLFDLAWSEHKPVCINKIQGKILDLLELIDPPKAAVDFSFLESAPPTPSIFSRDNHLETISTLDQEGFNWTEVFEILLPLIQDANYCWHNTHGNWQHNSGTIISLTAMKLLIAQIITDSTPSKFQNYWDLNQQSIKVSFATRLGRITKKSLLMQTALFYKINTLFKTYGFNWDVDFYLWQREGTIVPAAALLSELQPELHDLMWSSGYIFDSKTFCYTMITDKKNSLTLDEAWNLHEHACEEALKEWLVDLFKRQ